MPLFIFGAIGTIFSLGMILLGPFCWIWLFPSMEAKEILEGKVPSEIPTWMHVVLVVFMILGASNLNDKMQGKD